MCRARYLARVVSTWRCATVSYVLYHTLFSLRAWKASEHLSLCTKNVFGGEAGWAFRPHNCCFAAIGSNSPILNSGHFQIYGIACTGTFLHVGTVGTCLWEKYLIWKGSLRWQRRTPSGKELQGNSKKNRKLHLHTWCTWSLSLHLIIFSLHLSFSLNFWKSMERQDNSSWIEAHNDKNRENWGE